MKTTNGGEDCYLKLSITNLERLNRNKNSNQGISEGKYASYSVREIRKKMENTETNEWKIPFDSLSLSLCSFCILIFIILMYI